MMWKLHVKSLNTLLQLDRMSRVGRVPSTA